MPPSVFQEELRPNLHLFTIRRMEFILSIYNYSLCFLKEEIFQIPYVFTIRPLVLSVSFFMPNTINSSYLFPISQSRTIKTKAATFLTPALTDFQYDLLPNPNLSYKKESHEFILSITSFSASYK